MYWKGHLLANLRGFIVMNKVAERALTIPVSYDGLPGITFFPILKVQTWRNVLIQKLTFFESLTFQNFVIF